MNYLDKIQNTVDDIIAILEKYDDDWANVFKRIGSMPPTSKPDTN